MFHPFVLSLSKDPRRVFSDLVGGVGRRLTDR
jgi:hypothetical protein